MPMKKQPDGIKRTARIASEKPPQSYDIWLASDAGKEQIGWTERLGKGWAAHPVKDDGGEVPPFKEHTAAVEFLLRAYQGEEVHPGTQEGARAQESEDIGAMLAAEAADAEAVAETEEILASPETMAAIAEAESGAMTTIEQLVPESRDYDAPAEDDEQVQALVDGLADPPDDLDEAHDELLRLTPREAEQAGAAPFQDPGPDREAGPPEPDAVPFSAAEPPDEPWEYPAGDTGVPPVARTVTLEVVSGDSAVSAMGHVQEGLWQDGPPPAAPSLESLWKTPPADEDMS